MVFKIKSSIQAALLVMTTAVITGDIVAVFLVIGFASVALLITIAGEVVAIRQAVERYASDRADESQRQGGSDS